MAVVALAALIVKANDSLTIQGVDSPVFVAMLGGRNRGGNPPDNQFNDAAIGRDVFEPRDQAGLHVGNYANNCVRKQCGWLSLPLAVRREVEEYFLTPPSDQSRAEGAKREQRLLRLPRIGTDYSGGKSPPVRLHEFGKNSEHLFGGNFVGNLKSSN
jgi:hypothetical protein